MRARGCRVASFENDYRRRMGVECFVTDVQYMSLEIVNLLLKIKRKNRKHNVLFFLQSKKQ
ncbi:hypothetical protein OUZ56_027470 [Daphnia magna]|uniref:Uncharacterized protein n=1 Tax=Daphnia magna TaxID=35525 RepID=A0ABQ9ZPV6_9CRUS|nr:hypothetical protein OUZ56_027470 [Daphnia magna]